MPEPWDTCNGLLKIAVDSQVACHGILVAAGSGQGVLRVASLRQHIRPRSRSLKVAGPWRHFWQGAMWQRWQARDRERHTMQSEVGYLFSGYGREGRRGEEQRGRERERERGRGEMEAASLRGRGRD